MAGWEGTSHNQVNDYVVCECGQGKLCYHLNFLIEA
jgi:hypothetical protein